MKELQYKLTVIMAAALVAVGTALGAERVERSLGEGVRGWISMERPQMTARDAIVDRLDFVRFGIPFAEGTGAEDVSYGFVSFLPGTDGARIEICREVGV